MGVTSWEWQVEIDRSRGTGQEGQVKRDKSIGTSQKWQVKSEMLGVTSQQWQVKRTSQDSQAKSNSCRVKIQNDELRVKS